jgi:glycosyltransferase involved in cell wall biosynthesis
MRVKLSVVLEKRFVGAPDGTIWTDGGFAYSFWKRYLEVFDHVKVIARVRVVNATSSDLNRADGRGISFATIPYYIGPWQYLMRSISIKRATTNSIAPKGAVIMRVGSQIASCILPYLEKAGRPFGLEVVADPYGIFAPGSTRHPFRPFFRWWFVRQLRRQCTKACAVAYVTKEALQRRYPHSLDAFSTHYSSIDLTDSAFVASSRKVRKKTSLVLINVGSMAQLYKAQDILIDAVWKCVDHGFDLKLVIVGDGKHRGELETQVDVLGFGDRVTFTGQLHGSDAVRVQLDQADLFLLPSKHEGLPRAMIEAMARGLPCIGSKVGGIPELLPDEDTVPPGDSIVLSKKIEEVVSDPMRMAYMSARNLEKARDYREEILRERRMPFYRYIREKTEEWITLSNHD